MNATPPENQEVAKNTSLPAVRIAESDIRPIRQAAEAADLNMSVVVRECLIRYGQQTIVELVKDREFKATGSYNSPGRRRPPRGNRARKTTLAELVSYKYEVRTDIAKKWLALGRITVDGEVRTDPTFEIEVDGADRIGKASG